MAEIASYLRVFADAAGESHFQEVDSLLEPSVFAPPAPPLHLSAFTPVSRFAFVTAPGGWFGDWHPTPTRQWLTLLSGEIEIQVSDGEVRTFRRGDVLFLEDVTGRGHATTVRSAVPVRMAVAQL